MVSPLQSHIIQNGSGWYWEVIQGQEVIAHGTAETHTEARAAVDKVSSQEAEPWDVA